MTQAEMDLMSELRQRVELAESRAFQLTAELDAVWAVLNDQAPLAPVVSPVLDRARQTMAALRLLADVCDERYAAAGADL